MFLGKGQSHAKSFPKSNSHGMLSVCLLPLVFGHNTSYPHVHVRPAHDAACHMLRVRNPKSNGVCSLYLRSQDCLRFLDFKISYQPVHVRPAHLMVWQYASMLTASPQPIPIRIYDQCADGVLRTDEPIRLAISC
jgi:hypothetical protein